MCEHYHIENDCILYMLLSSLYFIFSYRPGVLYCTRCGRRDACRPRD